MRIFISAGEPSGDLHGANLIRAIQQLRPDADCVGFGGASMASAGGRLLYPLTQHAVMWFGRVFAEVPKFLSLLSLADRWFRHHRPDVVVLIDYPGFHWWLARRAKFHGIPVVYFVPPQLWGWGGWRIKKVRRFVDHVLCNLPFEEEWYRSRGVTAHHVGHPYFDELAGQRLDPEFLAAASTPGRPIVGLLPGSRNQEIKRNLPTMIRAASRVRAARPDVRFLVAAFREAHRQQIIQYLRDKDVPAEVHVGRTPEIIELSQACVAVSGSVGLELLYRLKPTVVVYRISPWERQLSNWLKTSRYISLVNLLAGQELFPEFLAVQCPAEQIAGQVLRWLNEPAATTLVRGQLAALKEKVARPGACGRAAQFVVDLLEKDLPQAA